MREFGIVYKYKNHFIKITKKKDSYYTANYTVNGQEYYSGNSDVDKIIKYFRSNVDKLTEKNMKGERTCEEVYKEWGNSYYKRINYKGNQLTIKLVPRVPLWVPFGEEIQKRVFYVGECSYYSEGNYNSKRKSFESIHYDKVVSKFERFVDEYCTDWQARADFPYKGYIIKIDQEKDKEFYIGYVQFHKNSIYKHIADTREEVERCCKNRIDRVIYEKEKIIEKKKKKTTTFYDEYKGYTLEITYEPTMSYPYQKEPYVGKVKELLLSWRGKTPEDIKKEFRDYFDERGMGRTINEKTKQEKIQELEQLQARISTQLEELKKEKDILTYKGVILEVTEIKNSVYGYSWEGFLKRINNSTPFREDSYEDLKKSFESYVDRLETQYNLYRELTGKD